MERLQSNDVVRSEIVNDLAPDTVDDLLRKIGSEHVGVYGTYYSGIASISSGIGGLSDDEQLRFGLALRRSIDDLYPNLSRRNSKTSGGDTNHEEDPDHFSK